MTVPRLAKLTPHRLAALNRLALSDREDAEHAMPFIAYLLGCSALGLIGIGLGIIILAFLLGPLW